MKYKIIKKSTDKEISIDTLAIEMYQAGSIIVYCDILGIAEIRGDYYILDECGAYDYIDTKKYKIEVN